MVAGFLDSAIEAATAIGASHHSVVAVDMELRHFRYFIAVADELHFARAAERLHIEKSPLSRAIKELEYDLGAQLFERTTRRTRLAWAGQVFLEDVQRVFAAIDQAKANVKAAAAGYRGTLRIALSDAVAPARLVPLLNLNVRFGLDLKVAFSPIMGVVPENKRLHGRHGFTPVQCCWNVRIDVRINRTHKNIYIMKL